MQLVIATDTQCRGTAMQQGAGGRMVPGSVTVTEGRLRFESADVSVEMPVDGLQLRAGGYNDEQLFFEHTRQPEWVLTTSDHAK